MIKDFIQEIKNQVASKRIKIAFENADSSLRVELIPSMIKYANKVILNFHKEFSVFSSFKGKENDRLLQDQVFKNKEEVVIKIPKENNCDIKDSVICDKQLLRFVQQSILRSQQAATRTRGKSIVNSPPPTYDQEPAIVVHDDEIVNSPPIMDLISLSFKKIYKPTNNFKTSSNASRANQDNTSRINRGIGECQKPKRAKDAAYHKEKMLLYKQEEVRFQLNAEQADWRDDTDDDPEDHELEAHYLEHLVQPESINDTYPDEQGDTNITNDSLDMSNNGGEDGQDDDTDLAREHDLLASLIEKLKCEIYKSKDRNKLVESSNKTLVDKLKRETEDFKNKNKCLESSNNHFKEANTKLAKNNHLMFKDLKKFQAKLDRYYDVNYVSKVEIDCAKAKGDLISYKMSSEKSFNEYTRKINDLNQMILEIRKELITHQESISIMSQEKEAQQKFYKLIKIENLKKSLL
nr:hypothetical protein [Tanacetum cinerariifolium]